MKTTIDIVVHAHVNDHKQSVVKEIPILALSQDKHGVLVATIDLTDWSKNEDRNN
jgi:hypothetical protein